MARDLVVTLAVLLIAACGGGDDATGTTRPAGTSSSTLPPAASASTTTTTAPLPPSVLSLSSGRGDDGSFEVTVWFASDPFGFDDYRIVVGADVDLAHPGVGDPFPFLDGHLELTPGTTTYALGDTVLATGGDVARSVSWGWADGALRVFFIDPTLVRGGTTWVIVEVDGEPVVGGVAGAAFGTVCSYHSAGLDLPAIAGVPDTGTPCRYPSG